VPPAAEVHAVVLDHTMNSAEQLRANHEQELQRNFSTPVIKSSSYFQPPNMMNFTGKFSVEFVA